MAKRIEITDFYLEKGISFSQCLPSMRCPGGMGNGSTQEAGNVDLVIQLDAANNPVRADAYQPDIGTCSRDPAVSSVCMGNFEFRGKPLADLINNSAGIQRVLKEPQDPILREIQELDSQSTNEGLVYSINPYYAIGLTAASCVAVTIAIMVRQLQKRNAFLNSIMRAGSLKQNTVMPIRASSVQAQASDLNVSSLNCNNRSATGLAQPDTDQKIEEILSRLDSLEQQMVSVLMKTSIKSEQIDESG